MSRNIDFSKPLSEDDVEYVNQRPWLLEDARLRGEDIITDDDFRVDDDETTDDQSGATEDSTDQEQSETEDAADDESDDAEDDAEDGDEADDEDEVLPYDQWDYADLKEEAGNRGLSKAGSKEQLIQRLTENDAESE